MCVEDGGCVCRGWWRCVYGMVEVCEGEVKGRSFCCLFCKVSWGRNEDVNFAPDLPSNQNLTVRVT